MSGRVTRFTDALRTSVLAGGKVLDFGCGSGEISRAVENAGWRVSGCDLSPRMIEVAKREAGRGSECYQTLDPMHPLPLPYKDASFDAVISSSVFEYLAEPWPTFSDIARILKPGGWLLFTVPDPRHPARVVEARKITLARFRPFWWLISKTRWQSEYQYLRISINRFPLDHWCGRLRDAGLSPDPIGACDDALALLRAKKA